MASHAPADAPRDTARMQRYLAGFALGAVLTVLSLVGALVGLRAADRLPPPQIANSLCIDEKLSGMRAHPPQEPNLLIVGSSVAWRHFNSPVAIATDPAIRPYNAGFCGAQISQSARVTAWLTQRLPSVRHIVLIASPFDFEACGFGETSRFDTGEADRFVFGHVSPAVFYARYFDPLTLASNARGIREDRASAASTSTLVQNRWGDGPAEPPVSRGLHYGDVRKLDAACFASLRGMARALEQRNIAFDVVLMPMQSEWSHRYGEPTLRTLEHGTRSALTGTRGRLYASLIRLPSTAYFDAMHLRWSSTGPFTRALLRETDASSLPHPASAP